MQGGCLDLGIAHIKAHLPAAMVRTKRINSPNIVFIETTYHLGPRCHISGQHGDVSIGQTVLSGLMHQGEDFVRTNDLGILRATLHPAKVARVQIK
ncbi:hypothetical protein D9M71_783740 [compost metagenome]